MAWIAIRSRAFINLRRRYEAIISWASPVLELRHKVSSLVSALFCFASRISHVKKKWSLYWGFSHSLSLLPWATLPSVRQSDETMLKWFMLFVCFSSLHRLFFFLARLADFCQLPKCVGQCKALIERYFFNTDTGECEMFYYGGCNGNSNNFRTLGACQRICCWYTKNDNRNKRKQNHPLCK